MFAITLKQKELDLQTQLMENRIRKLQLEEERSLKKISQTMIQAERFQQIQHAKDSHREALDAHRQAQDQGTEEQRKRCVQEKEERKQRLLQAYREDLGRKRGAKGEVDTVLQETKDIVRHQQKRDLSSKKSLINDIRLTINESINLRREQNEQLRQELAARYQDRTERIRGNIDRKQRQIE